MLSVPCAPVWTPLCKRTFPKRTVSMRPQSLLMTQVDHRCLLWLMPASSPWTGHCCPRLLRLLQTQLHLHRCHRREYRRHRW